MPQQLTMTVGRLKGILKKCDDSDSVSIYIPTGGIPGIHPAKQVEIHKRTKYGEPSSPADIDSDAEVLSEVQGVILFK